MQNEKFEVPDGLHSVSDIQDCFEYMMKKHEKVTENPPIRIYVTKIENRITFRIKAAYYLTTETIKLLGSTNSKITARKNSENVPHLEITEVILVHFNVVNNDYQQDSRVLYISVPNKSFGQLLDISPKNYFFKKGF